MIDTLFALVPIAITDAMFTSSTAPETDYAAWSGATTYAVGDRCISTTTHRIYENLRAANTDNDPTDILNRTGAAPWWQDNGPTNKWAMVDNIVSTQTSIASPLTFVLSPGHFNAAFFAGLDGETLDILVKDAPGGNTILDTTITLEGSAPPDYYEWLFDPFRPLTQYLVTGIDPYNTAEITVTITNSAGPAKCGIVALGDMRPLGATLRGTKAKPKSYSSIKIDEFGNNKIVRRKKATDMTATAWVKRIDAAAVQATIEELLDIPCVIIAPDVSCFGLLSGEISYDYPDDVLLTINGQGLI